MSGPVQIRTDETQADTFPAKCPECAWRSGPYDHPRRAADAVIEHVNKKHRALLEFLRYRPLPSSNENFARAACAEGMNHAMRLQQITQGSSIVDASGRGREIDVPREMMTFIIWAYKLLASNQDLALESRTGLPVLVLKPKETKS